ncbi:MAG: hypothetical protein ACRCUP_06210 [Mycoplasmatales bacterium]
MYGMYGMMFFTIFIIGLVLVAIILLIQTSLEKARQKRQEEIDSKLAAEILERNNLSPDEQKKIAVQARLLVYRYLEAIEQKSVSKLTNGFIDSVTAKGEEKINHLKETKQKVIFYKPKLTKFTLLNTYVENAHIVQAYTIDLVADTYFGIDETFSEKPELSNTSFKIDLLLIKDGNATANVAFSDRCPNCDAPVQIFQTIKCEYCRELIIDENNDWKVGAIRTDLDYLENL